MWQRVHTIIGASGTPDLDAQLMLRVRDGDEDSFRVLLDKHRNPLVRFLYRMVQNRPVSEELAQEVFLRIYKTRSSYAATAKFTTWMFRIGTHLALNWLRDEKHARLEEHLDEDRGWDLPVREVADRAPTVEQRMVVEARLREIRAAVFRLPEKQRAAVLMHKYEEMEYSQIASVLGCSEAALKSLLFRAYETLRAGLAHMVTGDER
ncbi:MAG: RNA polymerase sigma factor [Acidobacteriota bacterium]